MRLGACGFLASVAVLLAAVSACGDSEEAPTSPVSPDMVTAGELISRNDDRSIGCARCHGADAEGDDAGGIVGSSATSIHRSLRVPAMSSISLTDEQVESLAA